MDTAVFEKGVFEQGSSGAFLINYPCIATVVIDYDMTHNVNASAERFLKFRVANSDESITTDAVTQEVERNADTTARQWVLSFEVTPSMVGIDLFLQIASGATSLTSVSLNSARMTITSI
jgi:hypothetical protein